MTLEKRALHHTRPRHGERPLLAKFIEGRDKIIAADSPAESLVDPIRAQMTVPLVQGTLKYAYKADPANAGRRLVADAGNERLDRQRRLRQVVGRGLGLRRGRAPAGPPVRCSSRRDDQV